MELAQKKENLVKVFKKILEYQDELNSIINPNWKNEITDKQYAIALISELNELLECYNWEWWKKKDINLNNAKIEVVDMFHFLLSINILKSHYLGQVFITKTIDEFLQGIDKYNFYKSKKIKKTIIDKILYLNYLVSSFYHNNLNDYLEEFKKKKIENKISDELILCKICLSILKEININFFVIACEVFEEDIDSFVRMYMLKYILNILRQKYGYKLGNYKKMINNKEDNEFLHLIVEEINNTGIEKFTEKETLKHIFDKVESVITAYTTFL